MKAIFGNSYVRILLCLGLLVLVYQLATNADPVTRNALALLAAVVALFLVVRHVILWYWRINEIVALLSEISAKLGKP